MRRLQRAQALDDFKGLRRERNGLVGESFFFATRQGALSARFCELAAVFGEQRMAEEWMALFRSRLPPKLRGPAENGGETGASVLKQADQGIPVVKQKQFRFEGIQLVPHQVMKGHSRVLSRTLNEPIQRVPFLNLKPLVGHGPVPALGGGVGRVLGHSGLNGSGSGFGWAGGAGSGALRGVLGGAIGSVCGIGALVILPGKVARYRALQSPCRCDPRPAALVRAR
jgi:hypothetical protein